MMLLLPALVLAAAVATPPASDGDVVARIPGRALDADAFGAWLVERQGVENVLDFVVEQRVLDEARARDLLPTEAELEAALAAEREHRVRQFFNGKEERFLRDLANRGFSEEGWLARRRAELFVELAYAALARADRVVTDEQIAAAYEATYGPDGERVSIELLFYNAFAELPEEGRHDLAAAKQQTRARAERALQALREGASVAELLADADPKMSEHLDELGRVERYRKNLFGREIERAVTTLDDPGDLAGPVETWEGHYVVRLVDRQPVALEDVRDQIVATLSEAPVTSGEIIAVRMRLLESDEVEILLD